MAGRRGASRDCGRSWAANQVDGEGERLLGASARRAEGSAPFGQSHSAGVAGTGWADPSAPRSLQH